MTSRMHISRSRSIGSLTRICSFVLGDVSVSSRRCVSAFPRLCNYCIHQSLRSGFGVSTSEGRAPSPLSGQLAGGCRIEETASSPSRFSPVVHRSGDCGQLGEVGPQAFNSSTVPWHGDRHVSLASVSVSRSSGPLQRDSHAISTFLDSMALGVWLEEESQEHINVLEMRAVELALASFLPQLAGQSVIPMSNNTSVVAYLLHQGDTVSRRLCLMVSVISL